MAREPLFLLSGKSHGSQKESCEAHSQIGPHVQYGACSIAVITPQSLIFCAHNHRVQFSQPNMKPPVIRKIAANSGRGKKRNYLKNIKNTVR